MKKVINYFGHQFILKHYSTDIIVFDNKCISSYGEFECEICKINSAIKFITYEWYYGLWKKLDISCEEMLIKKLLE